MTRTAVTSRSSTPWAEWILPRTVARPLMWLAVSVAWLFLSLAMISFNSADWPSHVVAVHNDPVRNLCGTVGAVIAYNAYYAIGVGSWIVLLGLGFGLALTSIGRPITHPAVRFGGLILMALAVSAWHALLLPDSGPLAGAKAGLLATAAIGELAPRFSSVGTFLIIACGFCIGAVIAFDRLALAAPGAIAKASVAAGKASVNAVSTLRNMTERADADDQGVGSKRTSRRSTAAGSIDPDAGGIGATEAFDPDEHAAASEVEEAVEEAAEQAEANEDDSESASARRRLTPEELRAKIAKLPVRVASQAKTIARDEDIPRQAASSAAQEENFETFQFPTLDMLENPESNFSEKIEKMVRDQAQKLEEALQTYNIDGEVIGIESGPVVTLYSVQLAPGTRVARVQSVASDLARALQAQNIRVVPNQPGKTSIGIEVPNLHKEKVRLKELMSGGHASNMLLPMFLGKDASGEPLVADLTRMPHMLIAGTTGSGKSVCMNSIIMSWLYTKRPDELKLVLVDPKMVELSMFQDIPHLMCPVVTEMGRAAAILEWAVTKMEERYELFREAAVRDIANYNQLTEEELYERFQPTNDLERARIPKKLPFMVFIIDELADLIMTHKETEHFIVRLAQKARATGVHLIVATQRPQANVVTGLIKSNMPCRVSFKVASGMDSRIVMDQKGAELLLGQGDMLFLTPHTAEVTRAQGTFVTDQEIRKVTRFLKTVAMPNFERSLLAIRPGAADGDDESGADLSERDPMFDEAVKIMIETGRGSVSLLQRRLAIGYSRASRLVDQMGMAGILGEHKGSVAREVLITLEDWEQMKAMEAQQEADGTLFEDDSDEPLMVETAGDDEEDAVPAEYADEYRG